MSRHTPSVKLHMMGCLVLMGKKHKEIAEVCGTSTDHVSRCLESPDGQEMLDRLRREAQAQIFDPVHDQLQSYAREAMDELWKMRNSVVNERLKKDILVDVLHMAGYRPHTNTDRQVERLPTIIVGQQNIQINQGQGNDGGTQAPPPPQAIMEANRYGQQQNGPSGRSDHESFRSDEVWGRDEQSDATDQSGQQPGAWWTQGAERSGPGAAGRECPGDAWDESGEEPTFTTELVGAADRT